ncbi:MAG: glycosyltransferase [Phycisphaeraceae bacterium]|nr:glycosyltransferase [Phycisphaeraceae bacterium]
MTHELADALVLVLPRGESLASWAHRGLLEREWAIVAGVSPRYGRVVVVSEGGEVERAIGRTLRPAADVVCNEEASARESFLASAPSRVVGVLGRVKSVLIKTVQMQGSEVAVRIARALRDEGIRTGLVVRGEYLCSRFLAYEQGQSSEAVLAAAAEEGEACRAADVVVGTSRAMVGDLSWRSGLTADRTALIPNHVLEVELPALAEDRLEDEVLYAGPLVRRKRVDILIEAMSLLPDEVRERVHLTLIGDGPERSVLAGQARALGVDVRFEGWVAHPVVLERLRRCTVYAQASELEGHPKSVIEAMAAGAAVVVAESPGLGSTIEHGLSGLRLPLSAEAFGRTIEMLLMDAELRSSLGMAASRLVRDRMSVQRVVELELEVHARAMARAGAGVMLPSAGVRFDPELLRGTATEQASAWRRAIEGFALGLGPAARTSFVLALQRQMGSLGAPEDSSRECRPDAA